MTNTLPSRSAIARWGVTFLGQRQWWGCRLVGWGLVWLGILATAVGAAAQTPTLSELVAQTGLRGGMVFVPRTTEAASVVVLAANSPFIVYAQTDSETVLREIREQAAGKGLLAKKLYAELGPAGYLPLAPHSASVVAVIGATEAELTEANLVAWLTALAPERGVLVLTGARTAAEKRLATISGVFLRSSPAGCVWAGKHAGDGTDVWTHKFHDPSNARISADRTMRPPFLPQWYALPTHLGYWGDTMVADHGRAYHVWANRAQINSVSLRCYDLRTGLLLWERPFAWDKPRDNNSAGYYPGRSCLVVIGDGVALIDEADVLLLDGETGAERARIAGPQPGGQIKWLAQADGLLAVLAGEPDTFSTTSLQQISKNPHGRQLAVYDLNTRKAVWQAGEEGDIDEREIAIRDGRLYYHAQGKKVACRELKTGKVVWENREAAALELLGARTGRNLHELLISLRGMAAMPQALYFASSLLENTVALDPADGRLLWSEKLGKAPGRSVPDILTPAGVLRRGPQGEGLFDLRTNEKLGPGKAIGDSCGPSFAVGEYVFCAFGQVYQPADGTVVRGTDLKSPCDVGLIVSSGVAVSPASTCNCPLPIHGFRAFVGDAGPSLAEKPLGGAFKQGPAHGRPFVTEKDLAGQWPAFRHDVRRSGATAAQISATAPVSRWQWRPSVTNVVVNPKPGWGMRNLELPEHLPTQVVAVDGVAYFADSQGTVRALDLKSGAERWHFVVGSKVTVAPQWHRGRLLVGGADGVVYCLDAADGALAWSYRLAERERRILWYGHLASTWPVLGGLAASDGVVYAVAGFQRGYRLKATALDLATGKVLWQGEHQDEELGLAGILAVDEKRVLFHPGGVTPVALERATGQLIRAPVSKLMGATMAGELTYGRDVAVLPGGEAVYGGKRIYDDFSAWAKPANMRYVVAKADFDVATVPLRNLGADLIEGSMTPPVFDREVIVLARSFPGYKQLPQIQAWPVTELTGRLAALPDGVARRPFINKQFPYSFGSLVTKEAGLPEGGLWKERVSLPAYALVLTANAVLVAHPQDSKLENVKDWSLSALRREDGQALWSVNLPGRPAWDGLSVAADGSVLVALWDGSVCSLAAP